MTDGQIDTKKFRRFNRYYRAIEPILDKPKNRVYTAVIFSFLAISLFGWYAIRPTIQTILYLQREITDKTEVNRKMEDKIATLIEAQAAYQEVQDQLPLVYEAIPQTAKPVDFGIQLRNLISDNTEATYSAIRFSQVPLTKDATGTKSAPADKAQEMNVNLVAQGPYIDLEKIINGLNSMRRMVSYTAVTISTETEGEIPEASVSGGMYLKMTAGINAYYNP